MPRRGRDFAFLAKLGFGGDGGVTVSDVKWVTFNGKGVEIPTWMPQEVSKWLSKWVVTYL